MTTMPHRPHLLAILAVVLCVAPRAAAEDPADGNAAAANAVGPEVAALVDALRKAKNEAGLTQAIAKVPILSNDATEPGVKAALAEALGKVAKDKQLGGVRMEAVEAFGRFRDRKVAWKHLKGMVPDVKTEKPSDLDLAVVRTAGALGDGGAIDGLLLLADKAKATALAKEAVDAFTGYGYMDTDRKDKARILGGLLAIALRLEPVGGAAAGAPADPEVEVRSTEVGGAIVRAANSLTGRNHTREEWKALYAENKTNLGKLLPE